MQIMNIQRLDIQQTVLAPEVMAFLIAEFLAIKVAPDAHNTRRAYTEDLRRLGEFTMGDLSNRKLLAFKLKIIDMDRDGAPRAARSANRMLSTCRKFIRYLQERGLVATNYFDLIDGHKVDKQDSPYVALSDLDVRKMIDMPDRSTILGASQRMALVLAFYLGLRRGEIIGIRLGDIYEGVLTVKGKGRKIRRIALTDVVQDEINQYLMATATLVASMDPKRHLINSRESHGGAVDPATIHRWFTQIAELAGVATDALRAAGKKITPHTARATAITKALDAGVGIRDVANLAGHSSVETTTIYDKRRSEASKAAVMAIKY